MKYDITNNVSGTKITCESTNCLWNNAPKWNAKGYCTKDEIKLPLKDIKRYDGEWYDYTDCSDYEYTCKGKEFMKGSGPSV